jgi:serine/threonine protein kinase/serine phosphatase RsbU (regulator of sigma subunit)/tetratricopeptide (TPR) repeat protein
MRASLVPQAQGPELGIPGVIVHEELGRGAHSVVFLATYERRHVALKSCRSNVLDIAAAVRFRREAAALARLSHPGLAKVLCVGEDPSGRPYVMLEHVSGETLAMRIARRPLTEKETVALAIDLADALGEVHRRGLVHRDVKPANVMLNEAGRPKLIDFGLATQADASAAEREIVGTFAYSAPEQTGMMRRGIDGRADLYALGGVMFECLTGEPVFSASDPARLLQMHAIEPTPGVRTRRADVSPTLEAIIAKLLAKDPDDRYPSAQALYADLRAIDSLSPESALGRARDESSTGTLTALVGRAEELSQLAHVATRARTKKGALVWVEGEKGHGASQLLREWCDSEAWRGSVSLWAACSSRNQAPLEPLRGAITKLTRERGGAELSALLRAAAPDYVPVWALQFPALAPHLDCPAVDASSVSPDLAYEAVCELLVALANGLGGLILAVDDIEHVDTPTRAVLDRLVARVSELPIAIACTAQPSNEPHPLASHAGLTIRLGPLSEEGVAALAADFLGSEQVDAGLTTQLYARSGGAPSGVVQLLTAFLDQGLLTARFGHWCLDAERLRKVAIPESVEKLALQRVDGLPVPQREVLRVAALLGRDIDEQAVCQIGGLEAETVRSALAASVALHVIERAQDGDAVRHAFLHENVLEALTDELPPDERLSLHARGAAWYEQKLAAGDASACFGAATHYRGCVTQESAAKAFHALSRAGHACLEQHAFQEASQWLEGAREVGTTFALSVDHKVAWGLGEAYARCGRVEAAVTCFEEAARECRDPGDRSQIQLRLAEFAMWSGFDTERMAAHLDQGFCALGQRFPRGGALKLLSVALGYVLVTLFLEKLGWGFGRKAGDPAFRAQYKLVEQTGAYAFVKAQFVLVAYCLARNMYIGHAIGPSRELIWARAARAHSISAFGGKRAQVDAVASSAAELARELGDVTAQARVAQLHGSALFFQGAVSDAERVSADCLRRYGRVLDVSELIMCTMELSLSLTSRGYVSTARQYVEHCERMLRERSYQDDTRSEGFVLLSASLDFLEGQFTSMYRVQELKDKNPPSPTVNPLRWFMFHNLQLGLCHETDDVSVDVDQLMDELLESHLSPRTASWHHVPYWYQRVMVRYRQYMSGEKAEAPLRRKQVEEGLKALEACVRRDVDKWMLLHARGIHLALSGKYEQALDKLLEGEKIAELWDAPRGLFALRVERAAVLRTMGHVAAANREFTWALDLAEKMGWVLVARSVRRHYHLGAPSTHMASSTHVTVGSTAHTETVTAGLGLRRDRDALLAVSLAAAQSTDPHEQAHAVLAQVLSVLGGERAFVFLRSEGSDALRLYAARDGLGNLLDDQAPIARSLVERVATTLKPLVVSSIDEGVQLGFQSVVAHNLRSMICAPLMLRDRLLGVIYLDSRIASGVFDQQDLSILVGMASHIAIAHAAAMSAQYEIERRAREKDLELSAAVQSLLLPSETEARRGDIVLAAHFRPASRVAGDWWFYDFLSDGRLRIVVGDVTGHGAAAAMVSAVVAGWYRRTPKDHAHDVLLTLTGLHEGMRELCKGAFMMPMAAIEIDPQTFEMQFWSAGAPPLLLRRADGSTEVLQGRGMPIGGEVLDVPCKHTTLAPGDRLLLASDGLYELEAERGRPLGVRRVRAMFEQKAQSDLLAVRDELAAQIQEISGPVLDDDLTFVLVGRAARGV